MMVVMVMMTTTAAMLDHTGFFCAMLLFPFQFQGNMVDAMLCQFFPNGFFDFRRICIRYHMHGSEVSLTVHTPYMDMVDILHALNMANMVLQLFHVHTARCFLQEKITNLLQIFRCIYENKHRNANRHQRVND